MSETSQAPAPVPAAAPPATPAEHQSVFEKLTEPFHHAQAAPVPAELKAAIRAHAGEVFDAAGDVLAMLGTADPADAGAAALAGKVLAMAASAAKIAGAVHAA
jgi:hypothetical protein